MAPADMPVSAPAGGYHSNQSGGEAHASGSNIKLNQIGAPILTSISSRQPLLSAVSSTVLSTPPTDSPIAGGRAECYDDVRGMLSTQPNWGKEKEKVLMEPYQHLASRPGKEIRSHMIEAFNTWLGVPEEKIRVIHKVIGMLHTSSLLIDDVEDDSVLRRGAPVAHAIYGIPQTINTANYVYFLVFGEIISMNRGDDPARQIKIQEMMVEEIVNLHRGQGMDLYWRDNLVCPTEAEYIEMVNNKTSGLLRIVIKLMVANSPLFDDEKKDSKIDADVLIPLVNLIGLLFQIRDDYINLQSGDYAQNKGYCEDLTEGKFSFPLIHSIRASNEGEGVPHKAMNGLANGVSSGSGVSGTMQEPAVSSIHSREQLLAVLQQRPKDARTKQVVVEYMDKQTASFAYTRDVMARIDRLVHAETKSLEDTLAGGKENVRLRGILAALHKGWS